MKFHEAIYQAHADIGAILIAHPLHVMAFCGDRHAVRPRTIPESYILLREARKEPFEDIYRDPVAAAGKFSHRTPVIIYKNDCVTVTGETLLQAFDRLEVAEATANSIIASRDIGKLSISPMMKSEALKDAFHLTD